MIVAVSVTSVGTSEGGDNGEIGECIEGLRGSSTAVGKEKAEKLGDGKPFSRSIAYVFLSSKLEVKESDCFFRDGEGGEYAGRTC